MTRLVLVAISLAGVLFAEESASLWSLRPIHRPELPTVRNPAWVRNPVDRFVLNRLEREGLAPSPEASASTLLRRISLDLTGLPPTLEEQEEFAREDYGATVERLLRSPHYGENWGRHWLDQARYADSDGYRSDRFRPHAWRYRHWLIAALNRDMPFDEFTIEQLAGDLLPNATIDQKVATGFNRNTLTNREGGIDPEQFRVEQVIDRTSTLGTVWLGLTVGCAQCHDHKFDPITQKDFYSLVAFFNSSDEGTLDAPLPGEMGPYMLARPAYERKRDDLLKQYGVAALQADWEKGMLEASAHPGQRLDWDHAFDDLRTDLEYGEKLLRLGRSGRNRRQSKLFTDYFIENYKRVISKERAKALQFDVLLKELRELDKSFPDISQAPVLTLGAQPRETHILIRGDYRQPGVAVTPVTPAVLPPMKTDGAPTRLDLARWLVSRDQPLTARVIVNRIWQEYFGRGLVRTSENLGSQGEKPSNPELLDWLAAEFMESGWSLKHMHRLIVSSATYRQSSHVSPELLSRDPGNLLLARQSRVRLPAELIRDSALAASGLLNPTIGGRSVRPFQPAGASPHRWTESPAKDRYRRGMYIEFYRTSPFPLLASFDAPNGYGAACRRNRSTTALQALNLLNDPAFVEAAQALAVRILALGGTTEERLNYAFRVCLARSPDAREQKWLLTYFDRQKRELAENPESAAQISPSDPSPDSAAWVGLSSVILNLDEFITRE